MSLIKDVFNDAKDYRLKTRIITILSPKEWMRHHKWRKQRADRGWSDRDTWGAGDHIAAITADMLQHLNDHSYADWPEWFKLNVQEKGGYKDLQSVIDDIRAYLDIQWKSWADGLETKKDNIDQVFKKREDGMYEWVGPDWYRNGKKLNDVQITALIKSHMEKENKAYLKAQKAMQFFGRHFSGFWD